ncbi:hypothetical protein GCM10009540_21490 [Streptomyces turgidiscabies]
MSKANTQTTRTARKTRESNMSFKKIAPVKKACKGAPAPRKAAPKKAAPKRRPIDHKG